MSSLPYMTYISTAVLWMSPAMRSLALSSPPRLTAKIRIGRAILSQAFADAARASATEVRGSPVCPSPAMLASLFTRFSGYDS